LSEFQIEDVPAEASAVFGANLDKATSYAKALVDDSDQLGLLGPRELPKLWSRHILNSAVVAELLISGEVVADVGSGRGCREFPWRLQDLTLSLC